MFSVRLVKKDARSTIMQVLASVIMFSLAYSIIAGKRTDPADRASGSC